MITTAAREDIRESRPAKMAAARKNPKILLVDDEVCFTDMLKLNLELETDYKVFVENDSTQATRTAERTSPDIILLDAIMPGLDGFEVLCHLETDPLTRHIPVVFLTAISNVLSFPVSELSEIVERQTVSKPVSLADLVEVIESNLDQQKLRQ
ncbi:MAG: response regulator [Verrucomicrobiales bacterium]|nr:response regulator [Verrucomicrobiales bacterium]